MNPEVKAKWLAALRSGEFEQGQSQLRRRDKYCCLGVLCDLAVKEGVTQVRNGDYGNYSYGTDDDKSAYGLPTHVAKWADVVPNSPWVPYARDDGSPIKARELSSLNDNGHTFEEIADLIERHL